MDTKNCTERVLIWGICGVTQNMLFWNIILEKKWSYLLIGVDKSSVTILVQVLIHEVRSKLPLVESTS